MTSPGDVEFHARAIVAAFVPAAQLEHEGMRETPARMVRAMGELLSGYGEDPGRILKTFPADGYDQVIVVRRIPFVSMCEHHALPFEGVAALAYLPGERIVGLSKVARLVHAFARRFQVQERLTQQVAEAFQTYVRPKGVAVLVSARHTCMRLRGAKADGEMVTSVMFGVFRDKPEARIEVLELVR